MTQKATAINVKRERDGGEVSSRPRRSREISLDSQKKKRTVKKTAMKERKERI